MARVRSPIRGALMAGVSALTIGIGYHDGISYNAETGEVVIKAPGAAPTVTDLTTAFTFTGGNQSMYQGASGLLLQSVTNTPRVEYAVTTIGTNNCQQSQTFDNAIWTKTLCSVTANSAAAPDGTLTADSFIEDGTSGVHILLQNIAITAGTTYTWSVYAKASTRSFIEVLMPAGGFTSATSAYFNLTNGTVGTLANSPTTSITSVGNGWFRVSVSKAATVSGTFSFQLRLASSDPVNNYLGDGASGLFLWGAQFEAASSPSVYTATTSTVPAYTNSGANCLGLLMEAARTNLCLQSQDFSTGWVNTNSSETVNQIAAPDGTTTADLLIEAAGAGTHYIQTPGMAGLTATTIYTASMFVKKKERGHGRIVFIDTAGVDGAGAVYNLDTGVIVSTAPFGAGTVSASGITSYPNGWYRVWIAGIMNNAKVAGLILLQMADDSNNVSYNGDGTSGQYLWGAQLEAGSFPSSYIPTTTIAVARTQDQCSRFSVGAEISQTAGTMVVSGDTFDAAATVPCQLDDTTASNRILIYKANPSGNMHATIVAATVSQGDVNAGSNFGGGPFKCAMAWAANSMQLASSGTLGTEDVSITLPTVTALNIGTQAGPTAQINGHIRRFDYYPTRQTNAFLQQQSAA